MYDLNQTRVYKCLYLFACVKLLKIVCNQAIIVQLDLANPEPFDPSGAVNGIFQNMANTLTTDDLAPGVARSSAVMVLTMQNKWVHAFQ